MGTRLNRLGEAVLTYTHTLCFEQKKLKKNQNFSTENFHFYNFKNLCILHGRVSVMPRLYRVTSVSQRSNVKCKHAKHFILPPFVCLCRKNDTVCKINIPLAQMSVDS